MQHFLKDLTIMLSGKAFHAADTHRTTSEELHAQGVVEGKVWIRNANFFFFQESGKNWCGLDSRIYGTSLLCNSFTRLSCHRTENNTTLQSIKHNVQFHIVGLFNCNREPDTSLGKEQ
jgi:hypothetical protein